MGAVGSKDGPKPGNREYSESSHAGLSKLLRPSSSRVVRSLCGGGVANLGSPLRPLSAPVRSCGLLVVPGASLMQRRACNGASEASQAHLQLTVAGARAQLMR